MSSPRIKDVAERAQVSVGTVSNVLNQPDRVSEATRARVMAAIDSLGFVRNEAARQLRAGSSRAIAYLMLDAGNPFFTDVARGIEDLARAQGMTVFLCTSDHDPLREADYYNLLAEQRVRGLLVTPVNADDSALLAMPDRGIPTVLVDKGSGSAFCSVTVDDRHGGELALEHLLDLGHERVAVIGGAASLPQVRDRLEGARAAVAAFGLPPDTLTWMETAGLSVAEGRAAGQRLAGMPVRRRPTAAFCCNDLVALGLLQEMTRLGVSVPGELSIVGYDDIEFAAAAAVPLTSVRQPRELLGRTAVELLLAETDDGPAHRHRQVLFQPELIVRASSGRPDRGGPP